MVQGKQVVFTGALAIALGAGLVAQQSTGTQQQQSIPDAPRPQTLPKLNTITPVGPAVTAPAPIPEAPAVGSTLPSSPAARPVDEEPEPDIPPPGRGPEAFRLIVNTNFVEVPFTVKDSKGQLVPGITYRDVRVYENGLRQSPKLFTVDPFPLSVALVIDQSVPFDVMKKVNSALGALQGAFTPYDEVSVFTYNNGVKLQTVATAAQGGRLSAALETSKGKGRETAIIYGGPLAATNNINGRNVDPNTAPVHNSTRVFDVPEKEFHTLNDAILAAARETTKAGRGRRRVVYVISDGKEYGSKAHEREVIRYCQTNKVSVWATLVGDTAVPGLGFLDRIHLPLTMRDNALARYTSATGGQSDPEFLRKGIESSFAKITEEVRTQYTIGYYSKIPILNSSFRKIEVRVARPNLTIIAKDGYYPTASDSHPVPATPIATP